MCWSTLLPRDPGSLPLLRGEAGGCGETVQLGGLGQDRHYNQDMKQMNKLINAENIYGMKSEY